MTILVSHTSALEYWNTVGAKFLRDGASRRKATEAARLALDCTDKPRLESGNLRPGGCTLPLSVLVGNACARTSTSAIASRYVGGKLPDNSFADAGKGFLVSTPEFIFVQMATRIGLAELIRLGFELCGTYAENGKPASGARCMAPLTSSVKLRAFLEGAPEVYGKKKAARALRYVLDGSASPRETVLAILLSLPYRLGGFGLDGLLLNYRIDTGRRSQSMADRRYCVCDLYWPESKIAVEYDSDQWHTGAARIASDAKRRNTLLAQGIRVVGVTRAQLDDVEELRKVARLLAKMMGRRLRCMSPESVAAHYALRTELQVSVRSD